MRLSELLRAELIKVGLDAKNKDEAIEELTDLLISEHEVRLTDRTTVLQAVFSREKSLSTGMESGVALPHGSVDCVDEIVACLGVSKEGIPFESRDGKPAKLLILIIVPKAKFQKHVRTLAGIARLLNHEEFRNALTAVATSEDAMRLIEEEEQKEFFYDLK